jgi:hypothetical protein
LAKWSKELTKTLSRGICLKCGNHNGYFEFIEGTGPQINPGLRNRAYLLMYDGDEQKFIRRTVYREDSRFVCTKCQGTWPVFLGADQITILGLVNTRRTAVSLGFDDYIRDNRSSRVPISATIEISRRWLQRLELRWEAAETKGTTGKFVRYGADIERRVEQSLRTSLSMSEESEQLLKQTVNLTVPPGSRLTVRLHWKQVWQEGDLRVQLLDKTISEIPYRAAVELAFDQENVQS